MERQTMTAKEAANYLGISYWLLLEMTKRHEVPFIFAGTRKLFRRESLNRFLNEREQASVR